MQQQVQTEKDDVSVRAALADTPLQICFETLNDIPGELSGYAMETTVRVGEVAYTKNAPIVD